MQCDYFDAGVCRSCTWMGRPYAQQVDEVQQQVAGLLPAGTAWLPPVTGPESRFRTKAKMVVGGTVDAPTLGILDEHRHGVDLRRCGLHTAGITAAMPVLADLVTQARLTPYDVPGRTGELKHMLVTESPSGQLMVRLVSRSQEPVARLRKHLPWLAAALPALRVLTVNLQPEHKAVLEGDHELVLTEQTTLAMRLDGVVLHLGPRSFFQTNTGVARALYRQAAAWVAELGPATIWDLYCGVGGFALHLAGPGRDVTGVEVSADAVAAARLSAAEAALAGLTFLAADATVWAGEQPTAPDLVLVNPPRRGLGAELTGHLERLRPPWLLYSSCHAGSLARDLAALPSYRVDRAQVFDMFPQTPHTEVLTLLRLR